MGGNESPNADDIKTILDSGTFWDVQDSALKVTLASNNQASACAVSIEADSERVDKLLSELEGKSIEEVISAGVSKLASVPAGGGGGGGGGAASGGGGGGAAGQSSISYSDCVCVLQIDYVP